MRIGVSGLFLFLLHATRDRSAPDSPRQSLSCRVFVSIMVPRRCARPDCGFMVHTLADVCLCFCCKACMNGYFSENMGRADKHGRLCVKVGATEGAKRAEPEKTTIQAPGDYFKKRVVEALEVGSGAKPRGGQTAGRRHDDRSRERSPRRSRSREGRVRK